METLDVRIMGRDFRVACTNEERPLLLQAVNIVESKMTGIRDTGRIVGIDKMAIMAALQIAHESLGGGSSGTPVPSLDIDALERRMNGIDELLNAALQPEPVSSAPQNLF